MNGWSIRAQIVDFFCERSDGGSLTIPDACAVPRSGMNRALNEVLLCAVDMRSATLAC